MTVVVYGTTIVAINFIRNEYAYDENDRKKNL